MMRDLRKSKSLTMFIWLVGVVLFGIGFRRMHTYPALEFMILTGATLWAGVGVFSYYWGHQKGHPVRFYAIVLFTLFSVGFYLREISVLSGMWYPIIPLSIAGVTVWVLARYKTQFWDDFHAGIKRDHFKE